MAFNSGSDGTVEVSANGSAWSTLDNCQASSFDKTNKELETTHLADTFEDYIIGLLDMGGTFSGHFDYGAGNLLVRAAIMGGSRLDVRIKPNGTAGFKVQGLIESLTIEGESTSTLNYSFRWVSNSDETTV